MPFILKIVLCLCVSYIYYEINIDTKNDTKVLDNNYRLNVTGQTSINFKVRSCSEVSIGLRSEINNEPAIFTVLIGTEVSEILSPVKVLNTSRSGLLVNCDSYVNLWISWTSPTIKAGTGTYIGEKIFIEYLGLILYEWNYIEIASINQAYWMFDFPANSKNECTSAIPGSNDTAVDTTMTTPPTAHMNQTDLSTEPQSVCSCDSQKYIPIPDDALIQKIEQLRTELTVEIKKTSKYKRSLMSAADNRPSSKCIGSLSIVILVILFCIIVMMDFCHYAPYIFPKKK